MRGPISWGFPENSSPPGATRNNVERPHLATLKRLWVAAVVRVTDVSGRTLTLEGPVEILTESVASTGLPLAELCTLVDIFNGE